MEVGREGPEGQMVRRGERVPGILGHLSYSLFLLVDLPSLTRFLCLVGLVVFLAALEAHALAGSAARVPAEAASYFCR